MPNILHIDSSARLTGSVTRDLSQSIADELSNEATTITYRDVSKGLPFIDDSWIDANFTPADARSPAQKARLELSDALVNELIAADVIVLGVPVYNFNMPASLKAWVDQVARVGRTFRYTENGPIGLLEGKRVIVAFASGGTKISSPIDHLSGYLTHVLGFLGLQDVEFITPDILESEKSGKLEAARLSLHQLAA